MCMFVCYLFGKIIVLSLIANSSHINMQLCQNMSPTFNFVLFQLFFFRIHAEYQLNEPPKHPFWFTPAQFTGNLIITKDCSHVEHFHLYVPTNKTLNVGKF